MSAPGHRHSGSADITANQNLGGGDVPGRFCSSAKAVAANGHVTTAPEPQATGNFRHSVSVPGGGSVSGGSGVTSSLGSPPPLTLSTSFRTSNVLPISDSCSDSQSSRGGDHGNDVFSTQYSRGSGAADRQVDYFSRTHRQTSASSMSSRQPAAASGHVAEETPLLPPASEPATPSSSFRGDRWYHRWNRFSLNASQPAGQGSRDDDNTEGSYGSLADFDSHCPNPTMQQQQQSVPILSDRDRGSRAGGEGGFAIGRQRRRKPCPTCEGSGHLAKDNANELVALVPYHDQRLKPNRTKCYVTIATVLTVVAIGLTVFFLYPRQPSTTLCAKTKHYVERDLSTMDVLLELHFNVTNHNFFQMRLQNMSVSIYQVALALGTTIIRFNRDKNVPSEHTTMLKHTINGTFTGDQGRHACEQCNVNASQNFFLTLNIQLTTVYLGISTQNDFTLPHFFTCLPNSTFLHRPAPVLLASNPPGPVPLGFDLEYIPPERHTPDSEVVHRLHMASMQKSQRAYYKNSCQSITLTPVNTTVFAVRPRL